MKEDTKEGNTEGINRTEESHILLFKMNNILILNGKYPCPEQLDITLTL